MSLVQIRTLLLGIFVSFSLTACGFHLRETTALPTALQTVALTGVPLDRAFGKVLNQAFINARGRLVTADQSTTELRIRKLDEGQRVASFAADLSVRQYLVFLFVDYQVVINGKTVATQRIRLDKTFNYDADFILGKQEEERQIRRVLREEAARLILLRLNSL